MAVFSTSGSASAVAANVTLTSAYSALRVYNRGTVDLWVRTDGTTAVVAGDETLLVQSGKDDVLRLATNANWDQGQGGTRPTTSVISVIASAACPFTVVGANAN